jgi:hypothetical protein
MRISVTFWHIFGKNLCFFAFFVREAYLQAAYLKNTLARGRFVVFLFADLGRCGVRLPL